LNFEIIKFYFSVPSESAPKEKFTDSVIDTIYDGLNVDPTNKEVMKKLRYHKAVASFVNERTQDAVDDFTEALKFDETNCSLFLFRAKSYMSLRLYDDAIIDLLEVDKLNKCAKVATEVESMRRKVGKSYVPRSNYEFLEVPRTANDQEIARSFTSLKLLHKVNISKASTEAEVRKIDFKLKQIQVSFAILSNKKLKEKYDKHLVGEDAQIESASRREECSQSCYKICRDGIALVFAVGVVIGIGYFLWWSAGVWMIWAAVFLFLLSRCF
jgi:hypothetical protein